MDMRWLLLAGQPVSMIEGKAIITFRGAATQETLNDKYVCDNW